MKRRLLILSILLLSVGSADAQRPGGQPRPGSGPPPRDGRGPIGPDHRPDGGWVMPHDTNNNGNLEAEEFASALQRTFVELDRNGNGLIEPSEAVKHGGPIGPPMGGERPEQGKRILPPFFFLDRVQGIEKSIPRNEFERIAREVFAEMDRNGDGMLIRDEARQLPRKPGVEGKRPKGPSQPNAQFIAAELRFGDRLVKGQPFSAETLIEDTKRLFDGSTATKRRSGAIYRDGEGRTRREQPLEMVGGVNIVGTDNKPQMLVFINDFSAGSQIFLDLNNKVARKSFLPNGAPPMEPRPPANAKIESLGTKMLEGVSVDGTREVIEIPAGQVGNERPMQAIVEKWFSKELQVMVMSRHVDPIAGEHIFKLVNIKRAEPDPQVFAVPAGFRVEGLARRPGE